MLLHFGEGLHAMFIYALLDGNLNQHRYRLLLFQMFKSDFYHLSPSMSWRGATLPPMSLGMVDSTPDVVGRNCKSSCCHWQRGKYESWIKKKYPLEIRIPCLFIFMNRIQNYFTKFFGNTSKLASALCNFRK